MKAEIRDGKLTITPESYSEEFVLACFRNENEMKDGRTDKVSFGKYEESALLKGLVEEGRVGECCGELKPDEDCKCENQCVKGHGISVVFVDEAGTFTRDVIEFCHANQGGCVDPSNESCEMKCECFGFEESRKKARNFINRKELGIIGQADLERDEILKKAHEEAGEITKKAEEKAKLHAIEQKRITVTECSDMLSFAGHSRNNVVSLAEKEAEKIISEAKQKSQEASNYYRVTVEECAEMKLECAERLEKTNQSIEYRQKLIDNAEDDARKIVEDAHDRAETIRRDALKDYLKQAIKRSTQRSDLVLMTEKRCKESIEQCEKDCDEIIENAKADAAKIRREAVCSRMNTLGTSDTVKMINEDLAEKMWIKKRP